MHSQSNPPCRLPPEFSSAALPLAVRFGPHETTLRWLRQDDRERLLRFFASHSQETVRQRYGYARVQMTPEQAAQLVGVDQTRDAALGVFQDVQGESLLIAIGRYCLAADGVTAETAFVVHEQRRGLGIATTLLAALTAIAHERQLTTLTGQVAHDNASMLHVFQSAGATFSLIEGAAATQATIQIDRRQTAAQRRHHSHRRRSRRASLRKRRKRATRTASQPGHVRLHAHGTKSRRKPS